MIGEILKKLRKERNLTQHEISNIINVKQNSYSQYENNLRQPDIETLIKLANYYKVSLDYLTGRYKNGSE